jgi:pSer/pThr/pTyr-binding forkhead associated (FHA) protein
MPHLVIATGPLAGQRIRLDDELTIGREGTDVVIDDDELSRRHAALRPARGGVELEDLGSLNGTFVDGRRIEAPMLLGSGARIKMGATILHVEVEVEGAQATRLTQTPGPEGGTRVSPAPARDGEAGTAALQQPARTHHEPARPAVGTPPAALGPPAFRAASRRPPRRSGAATRLRSGTVFVTLVILADAAALILYFAMR